MREDTVRLWFAAILVGGALTYHGCGIHVETSSGERSGVVTKLSRKGLVLKTWEGEMNVGSSDVPGVGTVWAFTVGDDGPIAEVQRALTDGRKVRLSYIQYLRGGSVHGDTPYRIRAVTDASSPKGDEERKEERR